MDTTPEKAPLKKRCKCHIVPTHCPFLACSEVLLLSEMREHVDLHHHTGPSRLVSDNEWMEVSMSSLFTELPNGSFHWGREEWRGHLLFPIIFRSKDKSRYSFWVYLLGSEEAAKGFPLIRISLEGFRFKIEMDSEIRSASLSSQEILDAAVSPLTITAEQLKHCFSGENDDVIGVRYQILINKEEYVNENGTPLAPASALPGDVTAPAGKTGSPPEPGGATEKLKFRIAHPGGFAPTKASRGAAGFDLRAAHPARIRPRSFLGIETGVCIEPPPGTYGRISSRSGLAITHQVIVEGGVVDHDYRGDLKVILHNYSDVTFLVKAGDRIAQLICEKISYPVLEEQDSLSETERGSRGFGSTGQK